MLKLSYDVRKGKTYKKMIFVASSTHRIILDTCQSVHEESTNWPSKPTHQRGNNVLGFCLRHCLDASARCAARSCGVCTKKRSKPLSDFMKRQASFVFNSTERMFWREQVDAEEQERNFDDQPWYPRTVVLRSTEYCWL